MGFSLRALVSLIFFLYPSFRPDMDLLLLLYTSFTGACSRGHIGCNVCSFVRRLRFFFFGRHVSGEAGKQWKGCTGQPASCKIQFREHKTTIAFNRGSVNCSTLVMYN